MDTQQRKKEVCRLIVLVPHRDSLRPLEEYQARLFAAGFPGACSFPMSAPLASVSRPFNRDELKGFARNIRELTTRNGGKIHCSGGGRTKFTTEDTEKHGGRNGRNSKLSFGTAKLQAVREDSSTLCNANRRFDVVYFFGVSINLPIEEAIFPQTTKAKILEIITPPVLCAALLAPKERPPSEEGPVISFRAASVANLAIRPLESGAACYSFEWRIGPLVWLPKYKGG